MTATNPIQAHQRKHRKREVIGLGLVLSSCAVLSVVTDYAVIPLLGVIYFVAWWHHRGTVE